MPEKITKVYASNRAKLSVSWERPSPIAGQAKNASLEFVNHRLVTDDVDAQAFIESLPSFKEGLIRLRGLADDVADAEAVVSAAAKVAEDANKAHEAAKAALAALRPKKEPAAPKSDKA